MKTEWDYTALADAYLKRPGYATAAIDTLLDRAPVHGAKVCDVGAGAAHLTIMLAARGYDVTAIEPNDAMRAHGIDRTRRFPAVRWCDGTGEDTGQPTASFGLVTFGSSFNVTNRSLALKETDRILRPGGWFACLWNHRSLDDPIQKRIEDIIAAHVPGYAYGVRREDQTGIIRQSGRFGPVIYLEGAVIHQQTIEDYIEAWRSHGTLQRQAGQRFSETIDAIAGYVQSLAVQTIDVPYVTRVWAAPTLKTDG